MNKMKAVIAGLLASGLLVSAASAQGLLGERYVGADIGYEDASPGSQDGYGFGLEANLPLDFGGPQAAYGSDVNLDFDFIDFDNVDIMSFDGVYRAYMPLEGGLNPLAGAGLGWLDFDAGGGSTDTIYVPLELGLEWVNGPWSLTPLFRYSIAFDDNVNDFWSVGARVAYWFGNGWGATGSIDHTDYDGADKLGFRFGVVYAY